MQMNARLSLGTLLAALAAGGPLAGQSLERRIAGAPDGEVRFTYPARPGVCGDARSIVGGLNEGRGFTIHTVDGSSITIISDSGDADDLRRDCRPGPVHVVVTKSAGEAKRVRPYVGGEPPVRLDADLGAVPPQAAVDYLLGLAARAPRHAARNAILAAALADGARVSPGLTALARDRSVADDTRERAIVWLGRVADREGAGAEAHATIAAIAADAREPVDVRERAIREVPDSPRGDAFLRDLYARLDHDELRERVIRRVGDEAGPDDVAWLRGIALDPGERRDLRERAIRVLGQEPARTAELRALYPRLNDRELRERVLRVVGEHGGADDRRWLLSVALDAREHREIRERAVRVVAERGASSDELGQLYDRIGDREVRERILRILGDRGDAAAVEILARVAARDEDRDLRRRALRELGDIDSPAAREVLERMVRQR